MNQGYVVQINVNPNGGVPKHPVAVAEITYDGVRGDRQRDREHHGGPRRAVCLYSIERIIALQAEGHPIAPGTIGENLTIGGLDWDRLAIGDRLFIGAWVELEITEYTTPCNTIAGSFQRGWFSRVSQRLYPGWSRLYARVINEGEVKVGDAVIHLCAGE
ncbi:MOSC domain-containing protein [Chloroflexus sp.]